MEDEELVKMFDPILKRREAILFFLIVVINGLKCTVSDIGLDTCARGSYIINGEIIVVFETKSKSHRVRPHPHTHIGEILSRVLL